MVLLILFHSYNKEKMWINLRFERRFIVISDNLTYGAVSSYFSNKETRVSIGEGKGGEEEGRRGKKVTEEDIIYFLFSLKEENW